MFSGLPTNYRNLKCWFRTLTIPLIKSPYRRLWSSIISLISFGLFLLYLLSFYFELNKSEVLSLFQGIGSITSIVSGFLIVNFEIKKRREESIDDLKRNVDSFKLYVEYLLKDPIVVIEERESFSREIGIKNSEQMLFSLRIGVFEDILSEDNRKTLEKQFQIARDSLIRLNSIKNLEDLSLIGGLFYVIFTYGEKIRNEITEYEEIPHDIKEELEKNMNLISLSIKEIRRTTSELILPE